MKFATFERAGDPPTAGVVTGDAIHALPIDTSVLDLVRAGLPAALAEGARAARSSPPVPLTDVALLAPLRPPTLRDFVAFEEHVEGVRRAVEGAAGVPDAWYDAPAFYFSNPHSVVGTEHPVAVPGGSEALDYELEVAAVIGERGSDLDIGVAGDHIFGYTILNDWSARDLQGREMRVGLGPAKGKDFASTLGPWIVTADELHECKDSDGFLDLLCTAEINGSTVGQDVLSNMSWTFDALIAYASRDTVLVPGDVLGSGTVGNGGCLAELWGRRGSQQPAPLQVGDVVTLHVERIGSIRNQVVAGRKPSALPAPRRRDPAAARAQHASRGQLADAS